MKKVIIVMASLLIVSSALGAYFIFFNKDKNIKKEKDKIVYTDILEDTNIKVLKDLNVEFGKINYLKDFISIDNAEFKDEEIKYEDLGEVQIKFNYTLNGIKNYRIATFNIVDMTAPLATVPATKYILLGSDLGFLEDFWCGDNHDKIPDKTIEGYFDLSQYGSYNVTFVAKDISGNETRKPFTLKVVSSIPKSNGSSDDKDILSNPEFTNA